MSVCCCSLAGTAACRSCSNNPNADFPPTVRTNTITVTDGTFYTPTKLKAKWIKKSTRSFLGFINDRIYECSNCGNTLDFEAVNAGRGDANYCPNCGAEMEGGEDE